MSLILKKVTMKYSIIKHIIIVFLLSFSLVMYGENGITDNKSGERPKVGLVLSGGGAKGAAHIGVIRYIEEIGIPIDYIAGTSMGSIIGGLYSLGYTSEEMGEIISNLDWSKYMSNNSSREGTSFAEKELESKYVVNIPFDFSQKPDEVHAGRSFLQTLPSGVINGANLTNLFNSLSVGYQDSVDFNNFPIPFACVATDLVTGDPFIIRSGKFSTAIRASMAIPIVFDPVKIGDRIYVDGGLVKNFPVDVCKEMGADIVIGVSLAPGLEDNSEALNALPAQLKQLKEIITDKNASNYDKECDILIRPDLMGVGMLSFDSKSISKIIGSGYDCAKKMEEQFIQVKEKLEGYGPLKQQYNGEKAQNLSNQEFTVGNIEIEGVSEDEKLWLIKKSRIKRGTLIDIDKLDKAMSIIYGVGAFKSITYSVQPDDSVQNTYTVRIVPERLAPHNLNIGFRFDSQESAAIGLNFGVNNNKIRGFKGSFTSRLSYNPTVSATASYMTALLPAVNLSYKFKKSDLDLSDGHSAEINSKYYRHNIQLYLSEFYSRYLTSGLGVENDIFTPYKVFYSNDINLPQDTRTINTLGAFGFVKFDNKDQKYFATRGVEAYVDIKWKFWEFVENIGNEYHLGSTLIRFTGYIPLHKRVTLIPQLYGSFLYGRDAFSGTYNGWNKNFSGPTPAYSVYNNIFGGSMSGRYLDQQLPWIGTNKPTLGFNETLVLRTDLRVNLFRKHYLTAMFNYLRDGIDFKNFFKQEEELLWPEMYDHNAYNAWGCGVQYSIDTKIGPISLDVSYSDITNKVALYFNLGYNF